MEIKSEDVKRLREETGVGIMDCKSALIKAEGDLERAKKILREEGKELLAQKGRESRSADEWEDVANRLAEARRRLEDALRKHEAAAADSAISAGAKAQAEAGKEIGKAGEAECRLMDARGTFECVERMVRRDPYALLKQKA
jgi:hypothetical protein